jgi:hypothetical protein
MVTVAVRALELEYLIKILDWGRSRYIFTDSDSPALVEGKDLLSLLAIDHNFLAVQSVAYSLYRVSCTVSICTN